MRSLEDLKSDIEKLSYEQQERLSEWLTEHLALAWDKEIARDAEPGGPLQRLIEEALSELRAGKIRPLP